MFTLSFLYGIIIFVLLVGAFFIVYHILRYSLNDALGYFGAAIFGTVFVFLLFVNFVSFQSIETEDLFPELVVEPLLPTDTLTLPTATKSNPW